jgi:K+-sensing histidine kinase KdpD
MQMPTGMIGVDRAITETVNGTVLCLIDFSKEAGDVLHAAIKIAAASKSDLTVLYPYRLNQPRSISDITQWKRSIDADANNNFKRMTESLLKEYPVTCHFKSEVGFLNDRVAAYAEKNKIGMIILGKQMMMANHEAISPMLNNLEYPLLIIPSTKNIQ